jgi:hypothetical protein
MPAATPRVQALGAALLYLAYAVFLTWPVVLHLGSEAWGLPAGDLYGSIAHVREVVEHGIFPFAPATLHDFNAPFGVKQQWALELASLPGEGLLYGLSFLFGAVAGHTLFMLSGFVASGLAMFLLARRVTGTGWVALLAGFAFAFYPYAVGKSEGHLHFVHGWPLVLVAWRGLATLERPTLRNGLWLGAATALAMWWTPYYILIAGVELAVLFVAVAGAGLLRRGLGAHLKALAAACGPLVALGVLLAALQKAGAGSAAGALRTHPLSELTIFSARLHEYVVPDRHNLLLGGDTSTYLTTHLHGSNFSENDLYVGDSVSLVARLGAWFAARRWRAARRAGLDDAWAVAATIGAVLALVALVFSTPPQLTVLGHLVPTPSWFVFKATSTWRVYSRFVELVMLGLVLCAAVGLAGALRRRSPRARIALLLVATAILPLDLWAREPTSVASTTRAPDVYLALRGHPRGILAEYPIEPGDYPDYASLFYQYAHGMPVFQGYEGGSAQESRKLELDDPADPQTPHDLAAWGVRYVLIHNGAYAPNPPDLTKVGGYRRLYDKDPYGTLYEVTASPTRVLVDAVDGFAPPEGAPRFRWMTAPVGHLLLTGRCGVCSGRLQLFASSAAVPRTLTIRDPSGRVIATKLIGTQATTVRVPLRFTRAQTLALSVSPPPAPVPGDPRTLGIIVSHPVFIR